MTTHIFKFVTMVGATIAAHLIALALLYKAPPQPREQKVAFVDLQSLLLSQLKGNATQSDAELALKMKKLHSQIHQATKELSEETGSIILSKEALLSEAEDWTDVVKKKLETMP